MIQFEMTEVVLIVPLALLLIASIIDVRTREIPDWISVAVLLVAMSAAAMGAANIRIWMVVTGGLLGAVIGVLLVRFARLGGADAKLIAAVGSVLGPVGLLIALFWTGISGGGLALIALARGQRDYAYVPAIAAGYLGYLIWPVGVLQRFWQ